MLIDITMQVKFQIAGIDLKESEAKTLLTIDSQTPTLSVDLVDHLDTSLLDTKKLFKLSIEKKNPDLAALAAKLAISHPEIKINRKGRVKSPRASMATLEVDKLTLDSALDALLTTKGAKTAGAAMILNHLATVPEATMRNVAVSTVNAFARRKINPESTLFTGFAKVKGKYHPIIAKPRRGVKTYHTSNVYQTLRDGCSFLVQGGFLELEEQISYGSEDKKLSGVQKHLRRRVYQMKLTESGRVLADTWADTDEFITNYWNSRVN